MNQLNAICMNCNSKDCLLTDYIHGQIACSLCGVVKEERLIDETAEWRNFLDEKNQSRVGIATEFNPKLELQLIVKNKDSFLNQKRRISTNSSYDNLIIKFKKASEIFEMKKIFYQKSLDLLQIVYEKSKESHLKLKSQYIIALVIYHIYKNNDNFYELSEILFKLNLKKSSHQMKKCDNFLRSITKTKNLCLEDIISTIKKFCNLCDLDNSIKKTSITIFENINIRLVFDSFYPKIIAASIIFFTIKLLGLKQPDIIEISNKTNINDEKKIKKIYKLLSKNRKSIIPQELIHIQGNLDSIV